MRNIYLNTLLIIIISSLTGCNTQKKTIKNVFCRENVLVTYDKSEGDYNTIELTKEIRDNYNWVIIEFHQSFKDSIEIYFDKELFTTKKIEGNSKPETIFHKYNKRKSGVKLFLNSLTSESCMEILLDKEYNIVTLNKLDHQWQLEYSGYYEINSK